MASELEKWADAQERLIVIREFLEWLDEQRLEVATWRPDGNRMLPIIEDRERLLARHVGVDLNKLERERSALLKSCSSPRPSTNRRGHG